MPTSGLDYDKHGRIARVKPKAKDQDTRSITSGSGSSRKHRDSSASSTRTTLQAECLVSQPESTSSSVILDQLPSLPASGPGSPTSTQSPMSRSISSMSGSTAVTSPSVLRVPASLQPYLEDEADQSGIIEDSNATPRAEKTRAQSEIKTEPPKIELQDVTLPSNTDSASTAQQPANADTSKAARTRSSSQVTRATTPNLEAPKNPQDMAPKRPPSNISLEAGPPPAPDYVYGSPLPNQPPFQSPQLNYLAIPQVADPSINQQAMVPHGMMYYPEYSPQLPMPMPQQQLQYNAPPSGDVAGIDPATLIHRVQCALPDIHALVESHQDFQSLLESREAQIRSMETQRATEVQQQAVRFAQLESEMDSMVHHHAAESHRLKLSMDKVERKCNHLKEKIEADGKLREDLQATNETLQREKRRMERKYEEEKTAQMQKFASDRDSLQAEHRGKHKALHEQLQAHLQIHSQKAESHLALRIAECNRAHEREKQELEVVWTKRRREIEDKHEKAMSGLEETINAKQKIVDEERRTYLQAREGWDKERNMMLRRFDEERGLLRKASEEQQKFMTAKHERETNDLLKQVSHSHHKDDKEEIILKQQREIEALRAGWEADRFKFQQKASEFRSTAKTMNEQNNKLQHFMEAFGDVTNSKGK